MKKTLFNDYEPVFSPDGLSIVFTSERDGNKEIYIMNNEGKNLTNLSPTQDTIEDFIVFNAPRLAANIGLSGAIVSGAAE